MKLLKTLTDFLAGPIGSFGHFLGRAIADGYLDRMEQIAEEEHGAAQKLDSPVVWTDVTDYPEDGEDEIFIVSKKVKAGHGSN